MLPSPALALLHLLEEVEVAVQGIAGWHETLSLSPFLTSSLLAPWFQHTPDYPFPCLLGLTHKVCLYGIGVLFSRRSLECPWVMEVEGEVGSICTVWAERLGASGEGRRQPQVCPHSAEQSCLSRPREAQSSLQGNRQSPWSCRNAVTS